MLENSVKGIVYHLSSYHWKDKDSGQEVSIIKIFYIYRGDKDTESEVGFITGSTSIQFSQEAFNKIRDEYLLKTTNLSFEYVHDFKDRDKLIPKLKAINDLVIKQ